jgi:hypothetical protein
MKISESVTIDLEIILSSAPTNALNLSGVSFMEIFPLNFSMNFSFPYLHIPLTSFFSI